MWKKQTQELHIVWFNLYNLPEKETEGTEKRSVVARGGNGAWLNMNSGREYWNQQNITKSGFYYMQSFKKINQDMGGI